MWDEIRVSHTHTQKVTIETMEDFSFIVQLGKGGKVLNGILIFQWDNFEE